MIGTGASGFQLIGRSWPTRRPSCSCSSATPNWFLPTPQYTDDMTEPMLALYRSILRLRQLVHRLWLFWRLAEGALPAARVDPEWPAGGGAVSARNEELRGLLTLYLESQFADTPELLAHVVPDYPPLAKRNLLDNGTWARTLKRDHVHLITDPIDEIIPTGVTAGGTHHDVDVIVYATGFQASRFLTPMRVLGRGGRDLHDHWDGDARAHLGITVPGFPNFFCLYGPNTNLVANGSIIFFSECTVGYILECVRPLLLERHARASTAGSAHVRGVQRAHRRGERADGVGRVDGQQLVPATAAGRVTQNWPGSLLEFWEQARAHRPRAGDYDLL